MNFYFPDSQDQIDPSFDFVTEEHSELRVRQRDDLYVHEVLGKAPFDGLLVSKTIVDGHAESSARYSLSQRHRLYRVGIHRFFRLDRNRPRILTLGDCGAFSYVRQEEPPYNVDQLIDFYDGCGFDAGLSLDHVILGYTADEDAPVPDEWVARQELTLSLAGEFLRRHKARACTFTPVGVAQGWSPGSVARSVAELQRMGYRRIALGGMVPLKTDEIVQCLKAVDAVRLPDTEFHLLGVTRADYVATFAGYGVTSFDTTSPFRQAFKDDKDNYYALDRTYTAVRVPQVDGNASVRRRVRAGELDQRSALAAERACLESLNAYDAGKAGLDEVLADLERYAELLKEKPRTEAYRETLAAAPWKECPCQVCLRAGIHVVLFRGSERNKRRGFHNLYVYRKRLDRELAAPARASA